VGSVGQAGFLAFGVISYLIVELDKWLRRS